MRKIFLYIILIVFICFCIPIFFTNEFDNETKQVESTEVIGKSEEEKEDDAKSEENTIMVNIQR